MKKNINHKESDKCDTVSDDDLIKMIKQEFDAEAVRIEQETQLKSSDVSPEEIEAMRQSIKKII